MSTEQAAAPAEEQQKVENGSPDVKENGAAEEAVPEANNAENETPKEMRAVVLTGFGGLKTVKILKKPEPSAGEGEVLIRVKAW
ncbi:hypothetical protein WA026_018321 [Henosepilachna vigintioctopunctata]|uniref:Uncharacterized protein n=1 Tax=Henosepilachna vigintioctopunctata TaxID=420089 RepID=A0AAW1VAB2_9CUCU